MKAKSNGSGQQDHSHVLAEILRLRMASQYQAAEQMRRTLSARKMASYPPTSTEHAAVRLLIGTWVTISGLARVSKINRDQLFEVNPVGLMWSYLQEAVVIIRRSGEVSRDYAKDFEKLAADYRRWTKTPAGRRFRSPAAQASATMFG